MPITVEVAGKSDIGCIRTNNEDNLGYDSRYGIYVVCDGMGGQAAGEVASKLGVDTVLNYFRQAGPEKRYPQIVEPIDGASAAGNALASAIALANKAVLDTAAANPSRQGMGSTIVAALVDGNHLSIGHVGDSRIYLIRHGEIQQLTEDHSLVMEQVRRGYITIEQAMNSDVQNIILRALGSEEKVQADVEDLVALPGDILLLASDGLMRHVKDETILQIVTLSPSVQSACNDLIEAARTLGGSDNITCLLVKVVERPFLSHWFTKLFSSGGTPQWQNSI